MLPDCQLNTLREYLESINFHKVDSLCTFTSESWASHDNFNLVRFPIDEDPMLFCNLVAVMELELRKGIYEIPFYAKAIADRYDAEGHG